VASSNNEKNGRVWRSRQCPTELEETGSSISATSPLCHLSSPKGSSPKNQASTSFTLSGQRSKSSETLHTPVFRLGAGRRPSRLGCIQECSDAVSRISGQPPLPRTNHFRFRFRTAQGAHKIASSKTQSVRALQQRFSLFALKKHRVTYCSFPYLLSFPGQDRYEVPVSPKCPAEVQPAPRNGRVCDGAQR